MLERLSRCRAGRPRSGLAPYRLHRVPVTKQVARAGGGGPICSIHSQGEFLADNSRWFSKSKSALGETTRTRPSLSTGQRWGWGSSSPPAPQSPSRLQSGGGREHHHQLHIGEKEAAESAEVGKNAAVQARPCQWHKQVSTSGHPEDGAREHTPQNLSTRSRGPERPDSRVRRRQTASHRVRQLLGCPLQHPKPTALSSTQAGAVSRSDCTEVMLQTLRIPTSLCGPWRDRGREQSPPVRHALGFLPTVQAPAARGGVHRWKGITQLKTRCPSNT